MAKPPFDPSKPFDVVAEPKAAKPPFDPSKPFQTADEPKVGGVETYLGDVANAVPLGQQAVDSLASFYVSAKDRIAGVGRSGVKIKPEARQEMEHLGIQTPREDASSIGTWAGELARTHQSRERRLAAGESQNPIPAAAGTAPGVLLSLLAPLPKVSVGSGALGRVASNALTGAGYNALSGAANGDLKESLKGAGVGLGFGALMGLGTEGASKAAPWILDKARGAARRVLLNGADSMSSRGPIPDAVIDEAFASKAIRPFSTTQATHQRLQDLVEQQGQRYREIIDQLEAKGVRGPDADALAKELLAKGSELSRTTMNPALPGEYNTQARELLSKIPTAPSGPSSSARFSPGEQPPNLIPTDELGIRAPLGQWAEKPLTGATGNMRAPAASAQAAQAPAPAGRKLGLSQAEALKRSLQQQAKYGRFDETPLNEVRRDIASLFRQRIEDSVDQAGAAGDGEIQGLASQFVPVKQKLGRLLEAEKAASRGVARGSQRGALSLNDAVLAAGELAAGNPMKAAATAGASNFIRNRGRSALASYGYDLGRALDGGPMSIDPAMLYYGADALTPEEEQRARIEALRGR